MTKHLRCLCSFIVMIALFVGIMPGIHTVSMANGAETDDAEVMILSARERDAIALLHALGVLDTADIKELRLEDAPTRAEVTALCIRSLGIDVKEAEKQKENVDDTDLSANIDSENIKYTLDKYAELLLDQRGITAADGTVNVETSVFSDVSSAHWSYDAIQYGVALKLISGYPDGTFRPDAYVKGEEAIKILMCLTGYDVLAKPRGGYPTGYLQEANRVGVKLSEGKFDRMAFFVMLAKTLKVPLLKQTSFGNAAKYSESTGITLMGEMFDVYEGRGQITANHDAKLGTNYAAKGDVLIDNHSFHIGNTDAYDLIGYRCTYYARELEEGGSTLIALADIEDNEVISVASEDIISVNGIQSSKNGSVVYTEKKTDKEKKLEISSTAMYLYNGGELATVQDSDLLFDTGYITFIDSDNDGLYDVVSMIHDQIYWVDEVDTREETIVDRFSGEKIYLNKDDVDATVTIVNRDGKNVGFDSIADYDIIAVEKSNKAYGENIMKVVIVGQFMTGEVTSIADEYVYIDEMEYKKAPSFDENFALQVGEVYSFYFDTLGRAVASVKDTAQNTMWTYGYLIKYSKLNNALDENNQFVIMTMDGAKIYKSDEKTRLNGKKTDAQAMIAQLQDTAEKLVRPELPSEVADSIINELEKHGLLRQLIQFKEKDGMLTAVRSAQVKDEYTDDEKTYNLDHFSLDYKTTGSASADDDGDWIYRNYNFHYGEQYLADANAVCFSVPSVECEVDSSKVYTGRVSNIDTLLDENEYVSGSRSIFVSNVSTYQNVELYDSDVDYNVKSVVIKIKEPYGFSEIGVSVYIVDSIVKAIDESGTECYAIKYINSSGNAGKFYFDDSDLKSSGAWGYSGVRALDMKRGDVFFVRRGADGKIKHLAIIFRAPQKGNSVDNMFKFSDDTDGTKHASSNTRIHAANYFSYSSVIDRAPNTLVVEGRGVGGDTKSVGFTGASNVKTIVYDMERGRLTTGRYSDISKDDKVFVWAAYLAPKLFILYK